MRAHQIQTKLRKLEARIRSRPSKKDKLIRFLCYVWVVSASYYLGEPQPDERMSLHRIFGFQTEAELRTAASQGTFPAGRVLDQLLAKFGVTQNDDVDRLVEASKHMLAGLSEPYKKQLQEIVQDMVRRRELEWPIEFAELAIGFGPDPRGQ